MDEKELERRKQLRKVADKVLQVIKEEVESAVFLSDIGRLERLTSIVHIHMDSEVIRALREKGFDKEIRELCDRAGKIARTVKK